MSHQECRTQAEVDAAVAAGDVVVLSGSARAALSGSASAVDGKSGRALHQHRPVLLIGPIGSRKAMLAARFPIEGEPILETGCFYGSPAEFRAKLAKAYPTGQHTDEYAAALAMIDAIARRQA